MHEVSQLAEPQRPATAMFGQSYLNIAMHYLQLKGCDTARFLSQLELTDNEWHTRSFSLDEIIHCLNQAMLFTQDNSFPLRAGRRIHITNFLDLGTLLIHCPTVGDVIKNTIYFHNLTNSGEFNLSLSKENGRAYFRIAPNKDYTDLELSPLVDMTMAAFTNITFFLAYGKVISDLGKAEINFRHAPLAETCGYNDVFKIPVKFNQRHNQIVFSPHFLETPIYNANRDLYLLIKEHLERQVALWAQHLPAKDRIASFLKAADMPMSISIKCIASKLHSSVSTLQRKLYIEGTSYKEIKESVVLHRAKRLLANTRHSVLDIALELGFSDATCFSRTYRRLSRHSPNEFRAQINAQQECPIQALRRLNT